MYDFLLPHGTVISWKSLMFNNDARPKARFTVWLHCHGRMLTIDRLVKWGMAVNPLCSRDLCSWNVLLLNVFGTRSSHGLSGLQYLLLYETSKWIGLSGMLKARLKLLFKMIFAECIHAVLLEKNQRVFENKSTNSESIAREIGYICGVGEKPGLWTMIHHFTF
ncbi:uncharacterized protein LOC132639422 [Lycium barbarum]|uniref:uncharacterized protein LOC132639422 n=1 Tax=Lycium barbarum TaxID=112863 RepID=UPI00293E16E3|nr:uncharacterized protein LOC132639422 [Lycium barbarum]